MTTLWTREETLVALKIYCHTPFGRLHARNPEIIEVANKLGRTPGSLAMRCSNLASLDPAILETGRKGLDGASALDRQVWEEFSTGPEVVSLEAEQAYAKAMNEAPREAGVVEWENVVGLDSLAITKVRIKQQFFRSLILVSYRGRCAVCRLPLRELLVAAHIVPWSVDPSIRMTPTNGICLCASHDRAFDRGLLLVGADYKIAVRDGLARQADEESVEHLLLRHVGKTLDCPDRWPPAPEFLAKHAEIVAAM